jgi:DNA invertase Pin-like site-specific DNA recombinase
MEDIAQGRVNIVIVYKVDRLSRSLADFMRLVEAFDLANVSFVSVTQQFNTSTSMGRPTLNVLLSFAQFEREVTGERIRDKIAASKRKGMWMGGVVPLGYVVKDKRLIIDTERSKIVRMLYRRYLELGSVRSLKQALDMEGIAGRAGKPFSRGALYTLLRNPLYAGMVAHRHQHPAGQHEAIVELDTWERVQASLAEHRHKKSTRTTAKELSLLAGLLFDDRGHPMSPAMRPSTTAGIIIMSARRSSNSRNGRPAASCG